MKSEAHLLLRVKESNGQDGPKDLLRPRLTRRGRVGLDPFENSTGGASGWRGGPGVGVVARHHSVPPRAKVRRAGSSAARNSRSEEQRWWAWLRQAPLIGGRGLPFAHMWVLRA